MLCAAIFLNLKLWLKVKVWCQGRFLLYSAPRKSRILISCGLLVRERDTIRGNSIEILLYLLASERSERAQSCSCSIEISDTYVYICGRTSGYMCMLNSSLLGNENCAGPVVCNVERVNCQPLSKA